jgi:Ca-activated chloride channel homolog
MMILLSGRTDPGRGRLGRSARGRVTAGRAARNLGAALVVALALGTAGCSDGGTSLPSRGAAPNAGEHGGPGAGKSLGGGDQAEGAAGRGRGDLDDSAYHSTFGLDVDTASYTFARRALLERRRPEPGTVRPEEFVNHFRQEYREPAGNGFSMTTDGAKIPSAGRTDVRLVRVGLRTRAATEATRRDANLTFVVDTSGSMAGPDRLGLVQDALRTLVSRLRPTDSVAIVSYSGEARLLRPMTPARDRAALEEAIDALRPGSSTNLEAGMVLGYKEARRAFRPGATNRVILASDGIANVGNTTAAPISRKVADAAAAGVTLLCVGVGNDYGDRLMETLADRGNGMAVYVSEREQARSLFVERLPANLDLRARDAKAQVRFEPGTVGAYRLVGYDNRRLANEDFRDDAVDGGEVGPGHSVTALYVVMVRPGAEGNIGTVSVRWQDPDTRDPHEESRTIRLGDTEEEVWEASSARLQVSAVAAFFAENLRGTPPPDGREPGGPADAGEAADVPGGSDVATPATATPPGVPVSGPFVEAGRVPGEPAFGYGDLGETAGRLAALTRDPQVAELAELIRRAAEVA